MHYLDCAVVTFADEIAEQGLPGRSMMGPTTYASQDLADHCWSGRSGSEFDTGAIDPSQGISRSLACTLRKEDLLQVF